MEHTETKDVRLQIMFCKANFLRLISTQDSGLVKLRTRKASHQVASIFEDVIRDSEKQKMNENSFFAQITDDDIDCLFS